MKISFSQHIEKPARLVRLKSQSRARCDKKSTPKGCDETPIKTGFESVHTFVILRSRKTPHWLRPAIGMNTILGIS